MNLSAKFKVLKKLKKTSAVFFKDLKVGDEFDLVYTLNGGYESAPWIRIFQNGEQVHGNNARQLKDNLEKFEVEEVKPEAEKLKRYEDIIHYIANIDTMFMQPDGESREWNDREALEEIERTVMPVWNEACEKSREEANKLFAEWDIKI